MQKGEATSGVLKGLAWMALCGLIFASFMLLLKLKLPHLSAPQSSFMRYAGGLFWLLPYVLYKRCRGGAAATPLRLDRIALGRGAAHAVGVSLWFYAIVKMPIADVSALSNLGPVYATLGAVFLFGEKIHMRRLVAIALSFCGAMLIIRPGFAAINLGVYAMLLATPVFAVSDLLGKRLAVRDSNVTMVFQLTAIVAVFLALPAALVWVPVGSVDWLWAAVVGLLATVGHMCLSQAFKSSEMWVAQSGKFFQLIVAAAWGWLFLGAAVPLTTWVGGALIVTAISYIAWRESTLASRS